jgi:DNA end-binding protein Ku
MRSSWTGSIAVGKLVVPVKLGNAVSEEKVPLHRVRRSDGSRLTRKTLAVADGAEVAWDDQVPAYDLGGGELVTVEPEDFEKAYGESSRQARILAFTDMAKVPRTAYGTSYIVQPGPGGDKPYALLAESMRRTGKVAIAAIAVRQREALAVLYTDGDGYLMLERLEWASNVKSPDFGAPDPKLTEEEVTLMGKLTEQMTAPFDWKAQQDKSMENLATVIAAKASKETLTGALAPAEDLTAALSASIAPEAKPARKPRARKVTAVKDAA